MTAETSNLNMRIRTRLRDRFYKKCQRNDEVPSNVMRKLISDYTNGKIAYPVVQKGAAK